MTASVKVGNGAARYARSFRETPKPLIATDKNSGDVQYPPANRLGYQSIDSLLDMTPLLSCGRG